MSYIKKSYIKLVKVEWGFDPLDPTNPFYIEDASGTGGTFTFEPINGSDTHDIEYSTDNETWSSTKPALPANGRVFIRAISTRCSGYPDPVFEADVNFNVGGNVLSLYYGSNFTGLETAWPTGSGQFVNDCLFYNCQHIVSAEYLLLPVINLINTDYERYFQNSSLVKAPKRLPATTLSNYCYGYMFAGCTSLTTAPILGDVADPNVGNAYAYMFQDCSSLHSITSEMTSWSSNTAHNWVDGIAATGTFTKPSSNNMPTGTSGIPSGWTVVNV